MKGKTQDGNCLRPCEFLGLDCLRGDRCPNLLQLSLFDLKIQT